MKKHDLRIVFMGTPEFAVQSLKLLVDGGYNVVAVVTMLYPPSTRARRLPTAKSGVPMKTIRKSCRFIVEKCMVSADHCGINDRNCIILCEDTPFSPKKEYLCCAKCIDSTR